MFVSQWALNCRHPSSDICQRGGGRKRGCLVSEKAETGAAMALTAYGLLLTAVFKFTYLGQVLSSSDNDWPVVIHNLWGARNKWARLSQVIGQEGAYARTLGMFDIAVV